MLTLREPIYAKQLKVQGVMAALLKDALKPNLVQTLEHTPAIKPDAVVLVATIKAIKYHGGVEKEKMQEENIESIDIDEKGEIVGMF